jgi:hypothetical protein
MEHNPNTPHQGGTKAFKDLNYKQQALSINGSIANLGKAIRFHAAKAKSPRLEREVREKCVKQVERLANRLRT